MKSHDGGGEKRERGEITQWIELWRSGDAAAQERLFQSVYGDLRRLAGSFMRNERAGHTLPPTGLVNEVFLRLERSNASISQAENRRHFFAIAARAMRRILVENARYHAAACRPSARDAIPLEEANHLMAGESTVFEILAVDEALERLRAASERQAKVVELRYFAGLEESEVAKVLGISRATVTRDWRIARMMLRRFLSSESHMGGQAREGQ